MTTSRRTIIKSTAWTVPAITVATAAPAFASSSLVVCTPVAYKRPGETRNHAYQLIINCSVSGAIASVSVDSEMATEREDGWWVEFNNSRSTRMVTVTMADGSEWTGPVFFPPNTN